MNLAKWYFLKENYTFNSDGMHQPFKFKSWIISMYSILWVPKVGLCASWMLVSEYKKVGLVEMCATPSLLNGSSILILEIVHLSNGCLARTEKQIEP